ncbi:hypothetical protein BDZ97DRAFT_1020322 [Flammula alnicola]|nr:hypothetical protein BDZ97DRAFT_1020322 [Flammula alnicola]
MWATQVICTCEPVMRERPSEYLLSSSPNSLEPPNSILRSNAAVRENTQLFLILPPHFDYRHQTARGNNGHGCLTSSHDHCFNSIVLLNTDARSSVNKNSTDNCTYRCNANGRTNSKANNDNSAQQLWLEAQSPDYSNGYWRNAEQRERNVKAARA